MDQMMSGSFTAQATIEFQEKEIESLKREVEEVKEQSAGALLKHKQQEQLIKQLELSKAELEISESTLTE